MGTLSVEQLLQHWAQEKITIEQAVGYILQNLTQLQKDQHNVSKILNEILNQVRADPSRAER